MQVNTGIAFIPLLSAKYCLPAGLVKYFSCVPICGVEQWLRALLAQLELSYEDD